MYNRAQLIGNLGREASTRSTNNGGLVANFSIATTHYMKRGEAYEPVTTWHNIVCFGSQAEKASHLSKGDRVFVDGRIQHRSYEQNGQTKYVSEVVAEKVILFSKKQEASREEPVVEQDNSDIPF